MAMERTLTRGLLLATLALAGACGAAEEEGPDDPWAAAIPSADMLALESTGGEDATDLPDGTANEAAALARDVMEGLDRLRRDTHDALARLVAAVRPTEIRRGGTTCRVWEADDGSVRWQLVSCLVDARRDRYGWLLRGRPSGSTGEADYLPVFAGEGVALPAWNGARRGAGRAGYNFDHLAQLTGVDAGGQLGIGYRVAGDTRRLVLGLRDLHGPGATEAQTALFHFLHVAGTGGRFVFAAGGDFVTRDADDHLVAGQDGIEELGRVALAWRSTGEARTLATVCGGTVGEGACVWVSQCWTAAGDASHGAIGEEGPIWNEAACPDLALEMPPAEAPGEAEDEAGAPLVEEPAPDAP